MNQSATALPDYAMHKPISKLVRVNMLYCKNGYALGRIFKPVGV